MSDRAEYWRKRVEAWGRSGLSQAEYCRRQGLQPVRFSWWKRRLSAGAQAVGRGRRRHGGQAAIPAHFIEVRMPDAAGPEVYEIRLAGDRLQVCRWIQIVPEVKPQWTNGSLVAQPHPDRMRRIVVSAVVEMVKTCRIGRRARRRRRLVPT